MATEPSSRMAGSAWLDDAVSTWLVEAVLSIQEFAKIAVTEPDISKVSFMLDTSKFEIRIACITRFLSYTLSRKHGFAIVVVMELMLF